MRGAAHCSRPAVGAVASAAEATRRPPGASTYGTNTRYRVGGPGGKAERWRAPQRLDERALPVVTFCVLLLLVAAAAVAKIGLCRQIGVALCK